MDKVSKVTYQGTFTQPVATTIQGDARSSTTVYVGNVYGAAAASGSVPRVSVSGLSRSTWISK